jgi:Ca-activated chloride channel homolog
MKLAIRSWIWAMTVAVAVAVTPCHGSAKSFPPRGEVGPDKTLSPYFFVQSDDPSVDRLPLRSTRADIRISGIIADVTVTQSYKNEGKKTLEAIYIFPGSTRAAVYAMRMTVGERVIEAEIMERQKARATYEQARQAGQTASLLEQQRPNVFQMNVANILPGDDIRVEMKYTELIQPEDTVYEFVYPTVVGPRYSNTPSAGAPDTQKWVENPYMHEGQPAPYSFGLTLTLRTGIPIADLSSPSHEVHVRYSDKDEAHVELAEDSKAGTRDFVLRYRLAGGQIQTGALLHVGKRENFFLIMMEPPARVATEIVLPREYIFIVDVSGSMNGFPIQIGKALAEEIITGLRPSDRMNVLLFAGGSAILSEGQSLRASQENKKRAIDWIKSQRGSGGTELLPALERAFSLKKTESMSRVVVVITDGYVDVEPQAFELIRQKLGEANLFTFGIGTAVNRHLIEGMARVGNGEPFVLLNEVQARKEAERFRHYIQSPVLTDIRMEFRGVKVRDVEPLAVPDLFPLRPLVVFGKYDGESGGEVVIRGKSASGPIERIIPISQSMASAENGALRLLWARNRIVRLSDLNHLRPEDRRVKEVTELGLQHSLLTQYTSFVAVDKMKRADGTYETVKQPLPLPDGVSDLAVGRAPAAGGVRYKMAQPAPHSPSMVPPTGRQEASDRAAREGAPLVSGEVVRDKGGQPSPGNIVVTVEEVRGGLDRLGLEKALRSQRVELQACCNPESGGAPPQPGEMVLRLRIDASGKVDGIDVVSSTGGRTELLNCLKKALLALKLSPTQRGSGEAIVKVVCGAGS